MVVSSAGLSNALVVLGPTACGKTSLGVYLCTLFGGEVISADSRQVYRSLDIGTGKDLHEYGEVPYHLIDCASLPQEYNLFSFQKAAYVAITDILLRDRLPVIVGGTGMYLDSLVRGYRLLEVPENPALRASLADTDTGELARMLVEVKGPIHNTSDVTDRNRLLRAIEIAYYRKEADTGKGQQPVSSFDCTSILRPCIMGIRFPRDVLKKRIHTRLMERLAAGLVEEVASIHDTGITWERLEWLGLEYRFTAEYLQGKISSYDQYVQALYTGICRFAKRQETWFRGMERKGVVIHWIDEGNKEAAESLARKALGRL